MIGMLYLIPERKVFLGGIRKEFYSYYGMRLKRQNSPSSFKST